MSYEELKNLTAAIQSVATAVALVIGGYWTYRRFIQQRENYAFIEFTVDMNFIGKQEGCWIVELIANLENKGKVRHDFSDLSFDLEALCGGDAVSANEQFGGQAYFPRELAKKRPWLPRGEYFIEPGIKAKYSYVARIPESVSFVMLHGHFTYQNQVARHSAERTLKVPLDIEGGNSKLQALAQPSVAAEAPQASRR